MAKIGQIIYTARGFQQGAQEAMKGQIHRALIELITNADDAYGNAEGAIRVNVKEGTEPFAHVVEVADNARGLNAEQMEKCFAQMGGKNADIHNGGESRGLLGRGAKDVAIFGKVHFQAIKDGLYSDLELNNQGHTVIEFEDVEATADNYAELGIAEGTNGLKATIYVEKNGTKMPKATDLLATLKNHAQLRDLIVRRDVILSDYRLMAAAGKLVSDLPKGTPIGEYDLVLEGFDEGAKLILNKLDELQASAVSDTSPHGLLIVSGKSIFQNTWFNFDLPETRRVSGRVEAPIIMETIKAENNAQQIATHSILSITRDGLNMSHPLMKAISAAVKKTTQPILAEMAKETGKNQTQGEKLSKDLAVAAEAIKSDVLNIIRELDDEAPMPDPGDEFGELEVIPAVLMLNPTSKGTFSIRISDALDSNKVLAKSQTTGIKGLTSKLDESYAPTWKAHDRLANKKVSQWQFDAPTEVGIYPITFNVGEHSATVQLVVRKSDIGDPKPPTKLEFKPSKVTASPGRGKNLKLRAPITMARELIAISTSGVEIESAPTQVTLRETSNGAWAEAIVHIKTKTVQGIVNVRAVSPSGDEAEAVLTVSEAGASGNGPKFDFKLSGETGITRYTIDQSEGNFTCIVYGQHKSFSDVFGPYSEAESKFSKEDEPLARLALAETLANAFAAQLIELAFEKRPEEGWDPPKVLAESRRYVERLVKPLTKALVG